MLTEILSQPGLIIEMAYATKQNFTGDKIYDHAHCFLRHEAAVCLTRAIILAQGMGYKIKIFDAFRPTEAQEKLWAFCPDPQYVMPPKKGSPHSRGVAIDLTLVDSDDQELDMGTPFDDFKPLAHHCSLNVSKQVQCNRFVLLGLMTAAGFDFYENEWWHYQLHNSIDYPLLSNLDSPRPLIDLSGGNRTKL